MSLLVLAKTIGFIKVFQCFQTNKPTNQRKPTTIAKGTPPSVRGTNGTIWQAQKSEESESNAR